MGGPVVIAHGTEPQKERFLEPILSAEEIWCQGFSEPESGSDLASLKTKAVKEDGGWRITGQKVWTTFAHEAKWCMLVARSDQEAPKHKGLTYFLMDMEQDEIEVRPLRQITGEAEFNELFIENAWVPDENVVGGEGNGWMVAITTLMNERAGLGASAALGLANSLDELVELAKERGVADDPIVRDKVARLKIGIEGLRMGALRALTSTMKVGIPGPEGSIAKLQWSSTHQAMTELAHGHRRSRDARQGLRLGLPLPALARQLDRGRHDRRPEEHRRRARPLPSEAEVRHMDFDFTDEQREIKSTAREFLSSRFKPEHVRELAESDSPYRRRVGGDLRARLARHRDRRGVRRRGPRRGRADHPPGGARLRACAEPVHRQRLRRRRDPGRGLGRAEAEVARRASLRARSVARPR